MRNKKTGSSTLSLPNKHLTRRKFLKHSALAGAALAGALDSQAITALKKVVKKPLPQPNKSGIEHIIVVMMENRSFDHFLGWVPGAEGPPPGLAYTDDNDGMTYSPSPLAPDYQGCDHPDPAHDYEGARIEYNNGACDGWLRAGENDLYSIGFYAQDDLKFYANAAPTWTTFDRYFSAIAASTYPNKIYQHAAQTDRLDNSIFISDLPTIWDRLAEHSISRKYYFSDLPFIGLFGPRYLPITRHITEFYDDCRDGTLPGFCMVDPRFIGEEQGITNDDHPHADIRDGQAFLNSIYEAATNSPNWGSTVLVINYDEWGGFFDHVPPTKAPLPPGDAALGSDGLRGFRVPALVISPFARRNHVNHTLFDHCSVLRMVEWRWNLRPLTVRDLTAANLASALDFSRRDLTAPHWDVPPGPFGVPCPLQPTELDEWELLAEIAALLGYPIHL
jgi:phospholipase C